MSREKKQFWDVCLEEEYDTRDNDLANIFNTAKQTGTKWDLYMNIIAYLVKKWFLQEGIAEYLYLCKPPRWQTNQQLAWQPQSPKIKWSA